MSVFRAQAIRIAPTTGLLGPEAAAWADAALMEIGHFRPESSAHRPRTSLRLLHDGRAIYGLFQVRDQYVRCRHLDFGAPVYRDSCVEFFVQPRPGAGYFNFEFNSGGALLCFYITDPARIGGAFKEFVRLTPEEGRRVEARTSRPGLTEPEVVEPVDWWLAFALPMGVLERHTGPLGELSGQTWRVNAYKCGNETSHPHWAAWAPVDQLNFHLPHCFGELAFA